MNGPAHYREAEECLAVVANATDYDTPATRELLAVAQVHATLALAAATIAARESQVDGPSMEWLGVAG